MVRGHGVISQYLAKYSSHIFKAERTINTVYELIFPLCITLGQITQFNFNIGVKELFNTEFRVSPRVVKNTRVSWLPRGMTFNVLLN